MTPCPGWLQASPGASAGAAASAAPKFLVLSNLGALQQLSVNDCLKRLRGVGRAVKEETVTE